MSNLNKAFLKAYQKRESAAEPLPVGVAAPVVAPATKPTPATGQALPAPHFAAQPAAAAQAVAVSKTKAHVAAAGAGTEAPASIQAPETAPAAAAGVDPQSSPSPNAFAIVELAHPGLKPPHAKKFSPPQATTQAAKEPAKEPTAEPPIVARPQSTNVLSPVSGSNVWQPIFELSNFSWPEITEAILAAAPGQLQTAATDLAEACRRHRKLVAVTGVRGGEGCSVIAMTLARALAAQQQKVVLVDAHFAAPRLANCLGVAAEVGWEESLAGERPLAEAIVQSLADHVALLPLKQPTAADWRVADTRLKSCFDELRRHFDVVLIDAGPLGEPTDKRQLLAWAAPCRVDRALVVLDGRSEIEQAMTEVDSRLQGCGIAQWSFVDNFAAA